MSNWGLHEGREVGMRGFQRREIILELNLNFPPPDESLGLPALQGLTAMNDRNLPLQVEEPQDADSDDVVEISPRKFEEASMNAQRLRRRGFMNIMSIRTQQMLEAATREVLQELRERAEMPFVDVWCRTAHDQATETCDLSLRLNSREKKTESVPPAPPPSEPTFTCTICCGRMTEETSTKCGHIFCKQCILTAIDTQQKCPTCRRKLRSSDLRRVYLPAATYS